MSLLSIARWAYEQGLTCSPRHWGCLEKLLEVLVAVRDEVVCLDLAKRVLRIAPNHARAREVIECLARGLQSTKKGRQRAENGLSWDENGPEKKRQRLASGMDAMSAQWPVKESQLAAPEEQEALRKTVVKLPELSWQALIEGLTKGTKSSLVDSKLYLALDFILPDAESDQLRTPPEPEEDVSGKETSPEKADSELKAPEMDVDKPQVQNVQDEMADMEVEVQKDSDKVEDTKDPLVTKDHETKRSDAEGERDAKKSDQVPERRTTRAQVRTRQQDSVNEPLAKEKDFQALLEQYIVKSADVTAGPDVTARDDGTTRTDGTPGVDETVKPVLTEKVDVNGAKIPKQDEESQAVSHFISQHSLNSGLVHVGPQLLETLSRVQEDHLGVTLVLDLEERSRHWVESRSPECCLWLSELSLSQAEQTTDSETRDSHIAACEYNLCKLVESFALGRETAKGEFWVRYHWVTARLALLTGEKAEGILALNLCLSMFKQSATSLITLPIGVVPRKLDLLVVQKRLSEIQMQDLLSCSAKELMRKEKYLELLELLMPVVLPQWYSEQALPDLKPQAVVLDRKQKLEALQMLSLACDKVGESQLLTALRCHEEVLVLTLPELRPEPLEKVKRTKETDGEDESVVEEVGRVLKELVGCTAEVQRSLKKMDKKAPIDFLGRLQHLVLTSFNHFYITISSGKRNGLSLQNEAGHLADAAVAFCRLQQLAPHVSAQDQVSLLATLHDLLAVHGLCCAGKLATGGEGAFLKMAIQRLSIIELSLRNQTKNQIPERKVDEQIEATDKQVHETGNQAMEKGIEEVANVKEVLSQAQGAPKQQHKKRGVPEDADELFERQRREVGLDRVLDQCFFCLYGVDLSEREDFEVAKHANTSQGEFENQEQCAGVLHYILPYAETCSLRRLKQLKGVLRAIHKHFPQPPPDIIERYNIDSFLDGPDVDEASMFPSTPREYDFTSRQRFSNQDELLLEPARDLGKETDVKLRGTAVDVEPGNLRDSKGSEGPSQEQDLSLMTAINDFDARKAHPYYEVYSNLYYLVSRVEDMLAERQKDGFMEREEGKQFVEKNAALFKYDLCYNPERMYSWEWLSRVYDEEIDLLLNDGSKGTVPLEWLAKRSLCERVKTSRRRSRRAALKALQLAVTPQEKVAIEELLGLILYDEIQTVAPLFAHSCNRKNRRWTSLCQQAYRHFARASEIAPTWKYLVHMGKLIEKLNGSPIEALRLYREAVRISEGSVLEPFYRLHASRLKVLSGQNAKQSDVLEEIAKDCFLTESKEKAERLIRGLSKEPLEVPTTSGRGGEPLDVLTLSNKAQEPPDVPTTSATGKGPLDISVTRGQSLDVPSGGKEPLDVPSEGGERLKVPSEQGQYPNVPGGEPLESPDEGREPLDINSREEQPLDVPGNGLARLSAEGKPLDITSEGEEPLEGPREGTEPLDVLQECLFDDALSAVRWCMEGELRHFHKARFRVACALLHRARTEDVVQAKEILFASFSKGGPKHFQIHMWELASWRTKVSLPAGAIGFPRKWTLEYGTVESGRKYITAVRKHLRLFLTLCEYTRDLAALERAKKGLPENKKYYQCVKDIAQLAVCHYANALADVLSDHKAPKEQTADALARAYALWLEHATSWAELEAGFADPEIERHPEVTPENFQRYALQYIASLQESKDLSRLESINDRLRKKFRKVTGGSISELCRQAARALQHCLTAKLKDLESQPPRTQNPNQHEGRLEIPEEPDKVQLVDNDGQMIESHGLLRAAYVLHRNAVAGLVDDRADSLLLKAFAVEFGRQAEGFEEVLRHCEEENKKQRRRH